MKVLGIIGRRIEPNYTLKSTRLFPYPIFTTIKISALDDGFHYQVALQRLNLA